ncbi:hypothetical protein Peur_003380 [Populus x canadensis]
MAPEVLRNEPSNEKNVEVTRSLFHHLAFLTLDVPDNFHLVSSSEINDVQTEIIKPDYQPKSDVFGFGVILWEPMTVSIPWIKLDSLEVAGAVGFMDKRLVLPESLDPMVATIISDCWRSDPEEHPSFKEIIQRMTSMVQEIPVATVQRTP